MKKPNKQELLQQCQNAYANYEETKEELYLEVAFKYKIQANRLKYDDLPYCKSCKFYKDCYILKAFEAVQNEN